MPALFCAIYIDLLNFYKNPVKLSLSTFHRGENLGPVR